MSTIELRVEPQGEILKRYYENRSRVSLIRGPLGSGKTVQTILKILKLMTEQAPNDQGVRPSRWYAVRNCYDDQTEILTEERGWVLFKDLLTSDRVAMLQDGELVWAWPTYYYCQDYVGEMVGYEGEGIDFLVTPDHRMYVSHCYGRDQQWQDYEFKQAHEVEGKLSYKVKRDADWSGIDPEYSEDFFEWLGFWFAEGSSGVYHCSDEVTRYQCVITQKHDSDYVRGLFESCDLPYTIAARQDSGVTYRLRVTDETRPIIASLSRYGHAVSKWLPQWIKDAPSGHLSRFLEGYINGDGHRRKTTHAFTSSKRLADDLQEIALKAGWVANITEHGRAVGSKVAINGVGTQANAMSYCVTFVGHPKHEPRLTSKCNGNRNAGWYRTHYSGKVYCIEVPTHVVYVRRNNKPMWCGQTFLDLTSTTIKDWLEVAGDLGRYSLGGKELPHQNVHFDCGDGTVVKAEMIFAALDRDDHVRKIRGSQVTGWWLNEARELPKSIIDMCDLRHGRYPSKASAGVTPTWHGILGDYNPPDDDHWLYELAEHTRPKGWAFFSQPGGVYKGSDGEWHENPAAENLANLPTGYYVAGMEGKSDEWIRVNLANEYGTVFDGKPVYPAFSEKMHVADPYADLEPDPYLPLILAWDFGLTPSCLIGQLTMNGALRILDELETTDAGIKQFGRDKVRPFLANRYGGLRIGVSVGDPSGKSGSERDNISVLDTLNTPYQEGGVGIPTVPAYTNDINTRIDSVETFLTRLSDGEPAFTISPRCRTLRKGFMGGYRYRRVQTAGNESKFQDKPEKNRFSHLHDCLQYLAMAALYGMVDFDEPDPEAGQPETRGMAIMETGRSEIGGY